MQKKIISILLMNIILVSLLSVNVVIAIEKTDVQEDLDIIVISEQGDVFSSVGESEALSESSVVQNETSLEARESTDENTYDKSDTDNLLEFSSEAVPTDKSVLEHSSEPTSETNTAEDIMPLSIRSIFNHYASGHGYALRINNNKVQAIGTNEYGQLGTGSFAASDEFVDVIPGWGDKRIVQVETRGNTSYALTEDGELYAWGDNSRGQFGNGTTINSNQPVRAAGDLTGIGMVSAGFKHTVISKGGYLYFFGDNTYGQLCGVSDAEYVTEPMGRQVDIEHFEAGAYQTYYTGTDGECFSYGKNDKGQLGSMYDADGNCFSFRKICAGSNHVAAMGYDYKLYVWGDNNCGQLGKGIDELSVQIPINTGITITDVYAGNNATVYVSDGKSYIIGEDIYGNMFNTVKLNLPDGYSEMSLGDAYNFVYYSSGEVWRWGFMVNDTNMIEEGSVQPVKIEHAFNIVDIDAKRNQVLAIDTNGDVISWGEGYYSNGVDKTHTEMYPNILNMTGTDYGYQQYSRIDNPVSVSRGKNHNLVLDSNGNVWGWGSNSNSPMGNIGYLKVTAATVNTSLADTKIMAGGTEFSLFIKNDGSLWGLGKNDKHQLGYILENEDDSICDDLPIRITEKTDFKYATAGEDFGVAIAEDGLYSWGGNQYGQLGNGNNTDSLPERINITLDDGEFFVTAEAGTYHCIALTNKGNVYSWGKNGVGQLGIGNKTDKNTPCKINISDVKYINASENQSYAIKNDGTVWAWGTGADYRLGISNVGSNKTPVHISSLDGMNIETIVGANGFSVAVDKNGAMYSFGSNSYGGLGVYAQYPTLYYSDYSIELRELDSYMRNLPDKLTENINLPTSMESGMEIIWSSSNEYYISPNGTVTRPNKYANDEKVRLTAEITYNGESHIINYDLIVKKEEGSIDNSKTFNLNVEKGKTYIINIIGKNINNINNKTYEFTYDGGKVELIDAIARSKTLETLNGEKYGDTTITNSSIGSFSFNVSKVIPTGTKFNGFINGIVIRAKETCQTTVSVTY